eukprot:3138602-Pyramimonas_sp.AAC.1
MDQRPRGHVAHDSGDLQMQKLCCGGSSSCRGRARAPVITVLLFIIVQSFMFYDVDNGTVGLRDAFREPNYLARSDLKCADDAMLPSSDSGKFRT